MRFDELVARIIGWAGDRNLIEGSTYERQNVKLVEEFGEFAAGLARGKLDVQADALGDMMVIAVIMGVQAEVDLLGKLVEFTGAQDRSYEWVVGAVAANLQEIGIPKAFLMMAQNIGFLASCIDDGEEIEVALTLMFGSVLATCMEMGLAPAKVLEDVWNIIKDRKGKMIDGVFVKENDTMMGGGNAQ